MADLTLTPLATIKALVDQLHDLDVTPLHLHIDAKTVGDQRPDVRLWLRTRTDMETYCAALGIKPAEARFDREGQRTWSAIHDPAEFRLLVQCVSFAHHDDWIPRSTR